MGMKVMEGDEAFYYLHKDGILKGAVITHVDDFTLAGTPDFIKEVLEMVERELTILKVERDNFRFTGLDISTVEDGIEIEMADYVDSLRDIKEIRKVKKDDDLTKQEIKEYRKVTGKLGWLANSTRPDLSYTALAMSKRNNSAKISDLRNISRVLKKVRERGSKIKFSKIASRDELIIIGIGDASFKSEEKAVGGVLLFLANSSMMKASPIYWKSKQISCVCHSSKDAKTLNVSRMVDDAIFAARQVEILLYGDYRK